MWCVPSSYSRLWKRSRRGVDRTCPVSWHFRPLPFRPRRSRAGEFYWDGRTWVRKAPPHRARISQRKFSPVNKSGLVAARRQFIILSMFARSHSLQVWQATDRVYYICTKHSSIYILRCAFMCRGPWQRKWPACCLSPCAAIENGMQISHRFCNQRQIMAFTQHAPLRWICGGNECA